MSSIPTLVGCCLTKFRQYTQELPRKIEDEIAESEKHKEQHQRSSRDRACDRNRVCSFFFLPPSLPLDLKDTGTLEALIADVLPALECGVGYGAGWWYLGAHRWEKHPLLPADERRHRCGLTESHPFPFSRRRLHTFRISQKKAVRRPTPHTPCKGSHQGRRVWCALDL